MESHGKRTEARVLAMDGIVSRYEAALLRYAARIVADPDAAQDVVQETFIRLLEKWREALEPSAALSAWLYRVAHNCAVDHVRRESRRNAAHERHAEEQSALEERMDVPGPGFAGNDDAEKRAMAALRTLKPREQQLVILKVIEGKSYREISEIAGMSVGNVGYVLHHAMRKLACAARSGSGLT